MKDLTIRDKIAIEAMSAIINSGDISVVTGSKRELEVQRDIVSESAYRMADAMLKELEKKEGDL